MCRILALIRPHLLVERYGLERVGDSLVAALVTLANEGNSDACGIAVMKRDGRMAWVKVPMSCKNVARHIRRYRETLYSELLEDTLYLLAHARKATQGDPSYVPNNHPFCLDDLKMCLIHNGSVRSEALASDLEEEMLAKMEWPETDSAMLAAALAAKLAVEPEAPLYKAAEEAWQRFEGKASIAVFRDKEFLYTINKRATAYYGSYCEFTIIATASETIEALARVLGIKTARPYSDTEQPEDALYYRLIYDEMTLYIDRQGNHIVYRKPLVSCKDESHYYVHSYKYSYS